MEIVQVHIPDIPVWKNTVAASIDMGNVKTGGAIEFIKRNWEWILVVLIFLGGGIVYYLLTRQPKMDKIEKKNSTPYTSIIIKKPNIFRNF